MRKTTNSFTLFLLIITVAMAMSGCNRKAIYSHYESMTVDGWGWGKTDTLFYYLESIADSCDYTEEIGLRTTSAYPFTNFSMIVIQRVKPSGWERVDTMDFEIVSNDGHRNGQGMKFQNQTKVLRDITLAKGDSLTVCVIHNMRDDGIKGVAAVGVTICKKDTAK
jgi:gliding motility-associated lipoprotein GldH